MPRDLTTISMRAAQSWKGLLIAGLAIVAVIYLLPSFFGEMPAVLKGLPKDKISLGLDLRGGIHLVLEVETEKAIEIQMRRMGESLIADAREEGLEAQRIRVLPGFQLEIEVSDTADQEKMDELVANRYVALRPDRSVGKAGVLTYTLDERDVAARKRNAIDQSLETIRNRIDQFGVSEPTIQPQGEDMILVQLPGLKDPQRAIELLGKTAQLEFRMVERENVDPEEAKGTPPEDMEYLPENMRAPDGTTMRKVWYLVGPARLTGNSLRNARAQIDTQYNEPYVGLEFDPEGARRFEEITAENVDRKLAIVLDGNIYTAPVIKERISGGRAQITGIGSMEEAQDLSIVLRAGALPAPVTVLENRTVGPSLGADSVRRGFRSIVLGSLLVLVFMVFYYRTAGVIADVALCLNMLLLMGALAAFRATLTLPGIAGIVLTVGMAVDANVIIFERIREELRQGKTPGAAVEGGYAKALSALIDANLTTLIAALVLFQFGTGPVKGFAVTLSIGIITSMFSAIFVTRYIYDKMLRKMAVTRLSI